MQHGNNQQFGVVFVQMHTIGNKQQNIQHAVRLIQNAHQRYQPRLIVLPELFNTKWDRKSIEDAAEFIPNGETTNVLANLAKDLNIYLVGGSIVERDQKDNNLYNTTTVFAPNGNLIAKYRKIHLLDIEYEERIFDHEIRNIQLHENQFFRHGNQMVTFEMDGVKVGLGIGFDLSFGELANLYRKQGVHMLIYPSVYPTILGNHQWEQLNRTRAIDNQVFVLGVAQARDDQFNDNRRHEFVQHGRSIMVDPRGRVLARAGDDEEIVHVNLNFGDIDYARNNWQLFKNKRNDIYDTTYNV